MKGKLVWQLTPKDRAIVAPVLQEWGWLLPSWVHVLRIKMGERQPEDGPDTPCDIATQVEYRAALLTLYPQIHTMTAPEREAALVHELVHCYGSPFHDFTESLISSLLPEDEGTGRWTREIFKQQHEAATTELADALLARKRGGKL